jgi:hypothetical protein
MSLGNGNYTNGNKGSNFNYELKVLQGLERIKEAADNINPNIDKCPLEFPFKAGSVGPTISFVKPNDADYEVVKDVIIPGELEITRGNIRGIYNIALESSYDNGSYVSPLNTYWCSQYTDPNIFGNPLAPLTDIPNRTYDNWRTAVDGNPPASVGIPMIMKWDNGSDAPRYWVVEFTEWGIGSDYNNFGYTRYELFLSVNFEQPSSSNPNETQVIDIVSSGVHLARKYTGGGLYNIVSESQYDDLSPKDTRWNSEYTDSRTGYSGFNDLSNVESRIYLDFQNALDGSIGSNVLNTDLVMHDLTTDLYYKVVFDSWAQGCNQITSGYPGKPTGWNTINAGSGYPDGGWYNPTVTGGSGTNGDVIIQVSSGTPYIIAWQGGVGYEVGDIITLDYPGVTDPTVIKLTTLCSMGGFSYTRTVIPQSCGITFADGTTMNTAPTPGSGDGSVATQGTSMYSTNPPTSNFNTNYGIYLGEQAGNGTNDQKNVMLGYYAGNDATGVYNANFIGVNAGENADNANKSNFIGHRAGNNATGSSHSNFIGRYAGTSASNSYSSNFIGEYAGAYLTNSTYSNFIGFYAGYGASSIIYSNFFGMYAGFGSTSSSNSNFLGNAAGQSSVNGYNSNFLGQQAGQVSNNANYSNFIGTGAGYNSVNSYQSNFIGQNAGFISTNTYYCNFFGVNAGQTSSGNNVNAFGVNAGVNNALNGQTIFSNSSMPTFANHAAAVAAITVPLGASAGNTYLYHNQATNSIGAVRL